MKKTLLAVALAVASLGASAHYLPSTHYHDDAGRVVIGNQIKPEVKTTYETDARGRRIRVTETTTCTEVRVNRRNNHLRCLEEETTTRRQVVYNAPAPMPAPVVEDRIVSRSIERIDGRRYIVTVVDRCVAPRRDRDGDVYCGDWERRTERELVRRNPRSASLDLDGDGQTNGWERLLYQSFRNALDNN